jgi:outer membrane biogenesis lipoprotein LolB
MRHLKRPALLGLLLLACLLLAGCRMDSTVEELSSNDCRNSRTSCRERMSISAVIRP